MEYPLEHNPETLGLFRQNNHRKFVPQFEALGAIVGMIPLHIASISHSWSDTFPPQVSLETEN